MAEDARDLAELYVNTMKVHPEGYALYLPQPFSILKPGSCGYLDKDRQWNPIVDLTKPSAISKAGYEPIETLQRGPTGRPTWKPKPSRYVTSSSFAIDANISADQLGLPVGCTTAFKYHSSRDFGAILLCEAEVLEERYFHESPFRKWLKTNLETILKKVEDVREHGVYIVTKTFSTNKCSINVWTEKSNEVIIGVGAKVPSVAGADVSGGWSRGHSSSSWRSWVRKPLPSFQFIIDVQLGRREARRVLHWHIR